MNNELNDCTCRACRAERGEAGFPASVAPVAAGTIDTPIQRFYASPQIGEGAIAADDGELVLYTDHLKHTAAAVEARAEDLARSFVRDLAAERDAALAELSKLRAATAPVSAVPAASDAWTTPQVAQNLDRQYRDGFTAGWTACIDGNEEALGAVLARVKPVAEYDAGAPVSGAEQAAAQNEANSPQTRMDAWFGALFEAGATPAGGQELPASATFSYARNPLEQMETMGCHTAYYTKNPLGEYTYADPQPTLLKPEYRNLSGPLAMRQPQGDGSKTVSISLDAAEHALAAMKEKYFAGGYNNLYADDRSFVVHSMNELKDGIAAKQVGKEAS